MAGLTFHTPGRNQGQIVEVSYAMWNDMVYKRVHDRSDQTTQYWRSRALVNDQGEYWGYAPSNRRWREITEDDLPGRYDEDE